MKLIQTGSDTAGLILDLIFAGNHNFFSSAVCEMNLSLFLIIYLSVPVKYPEKGKAFC